MEEESSLDTLRPGRRALVGQIAARGALGRRLRDFGFLPGARVECLSRSPLGDPAAYRVRGAVIALRRKDAGLVAIRPL